MKKIFTLIAAALFATGMWANQTDLISGVTLPDVPGSSLDMTSQTFKTPDDNGWIVMQPNADIRNASVTWFTAMAWNTTSVTISDVSSFTAPFTTLNSASCTTVQKTGRTKAIRFTGATDISFLVLSGGSRTIYVSLYSYAEETQTLVETKSTGQNSATELLFSSLSTTTDYIAYMYESTNSNGVVAEIAIKKYVNTSTPVGEVTIDGPTRGTKGYKATFTATIDAKADEIKWFVNDAEQTGATDKTFEFTPVTAGDYSIVCKARNDNNVTDEWIASSPIAFKALNKLNGELIKATLTSGSAATVTGVIGGTADVSLSSNKKMDDSKYFGITLASGSFQEGDTVVITMTTAGSNYPCLFADKNRTNCLYLATATSSDLEYKILLPAAAEGLTSLYLSRKDDENYKWNPVLSSMSVIRPIDIKSSDTTLTAVSINGVAMSSDSLAELLTKEWITLKGTFVAQPTIVYTKHIVITYDDDSQAEKNVNVTVPVIDDPDEPEDYWLATDTIGGVAYDIYIEKELSYRAVYFYGTDTIGVENIALGGSPDVAYYGAITTGIPALSVIDAWYEDAELTQSITPGKYKQSTTADKNFYAKVAYKYASSINFEELIMDNGKSYASVNQLGTRNYASNYGSTGMDVSNDSLDNSKTKRNYPYLGLKVKTAGALLNFRLAAGKTVKIKFGNVPTVPQVSVNGGDYANITITNGVYTHTAEAEELISLKHISGSMVFQQIAIDEELAAPELFAITCAETEHGTIGTAYKMGIPGEIIAVSVVRDGGYKATSVTANGDEIESLSETTYQFTMPAADVTVAAVFSVATGVDNTEVEGKAVKRLVNGQLVIEKNGKTYTVTGLEVR